MTIGTLSRRLALIALSGLIWFMVISSFYGNRPTKPGPVLAATVLILISATLYFLLRGRRYAIELSTLLAGCTVIAAFLSVLVWNRVLDILEQKGIM